MVIRSAKKLLVLLLATMTWSVPGWASDVEDAEKAELAKQQAFRAGMERIVDDLNDNWYDTFIGSINRQDMLDRIFQLRLIDQQVKKSFLENLDFTWNDLIIAQFGDADDELKATLLGVESRGNRGRAVVRFDLPNFQFNYHEYDLLLDEQGRMFVVDWTDYLDGTVFSEGMGQWLVTAMPSKPAMRKLLNFRDVKDIELFQFGELLKASRDSKLPRYLEILGDLPERIQRQRVVVEMTVHLAKRVRKRRAMLTGLRTMAEYYPDEPLYALMLLDHYFPARKYKEASTALLRVYDKLDVDDAAMEARLSAAALVMGNTQDAVAYADRALELESDLELAWWSALRARTVGADFAGAVTALEQLEGQFGYDLDPEDFKKDHSFKDLIASTEYQGWLASH